MLRRLVSLLLVLCAAFAVKANAASVCPALTGADSTYLAAATVAGTNCNTLITINANGTLSFSYPNLHPYDGSEDNYVGVINNSSSAVSSLALSGTSDIFGFDGDGIDNYGLSGNSMDTSGYGGADAYFSAVNAFGTSGNVDFVKALSANGGTGYFSLELAPAGGNSITGTVSGATPEPNSLALLGTGLCSLAGLLHRRVRQAA